MAVQLPWTKGLDAFATQFTAQLTVSGPPNSEHAIQLYVALGFQTAFDFQLGSIVFERPLGPRRIDLWFVPLGLAMEVKFDRARPAGGSRAATLGLGGLLADANKLARVDAPHRVVLLVCDDAGRRYLARNADAVFALTLGHARPVSPDTLAHLPPTAAHAAVDDGPWVPLTTELGWACGWEHWHAFTWQVR
jgi:hypothetical protein